MKQVLLNLYLNSLQAMDGGGLLEVKVHPDAEKKKTHIIVADSGHGIEGTHLDRIFDPYFTTKTGGTGLGLAIVHKVIEAHGGEVKVQSTPGKGTTLTLILPNAEEIEGDDQG
jgi:two-component system sensor histidine kinase HydH